MENKGGKASNAISQLGQIYTAWKKFMEVVDQLSGSLASFQKAAKIFQNQFIGTKLHLYRNGTIYKFCTRDGATFGVCVKLVLQMLSAAGSPTIAVAIPMLVKTIAMHPILAAEFVREAVVPPLLAAAKQLEAEAIKVVNTVLKEIFGEKVMVSTISSYTSADLEKLFRDKHPQVVTDEAQVSSGGGNLRGETLFPLPSVLLPEIGFESSSPYIKSTSATLVSQNGNVQQNTEEEYEFTNNQGVYVKKEFGEVVEEKEFDLENFLKQRPYSLTPRALYSQPKIEDVAEWKEVLDETTGKTYYWNPETGDTRWNRPGEEEEEEEEWKEAVDAKGRTFYFNTQTGETKWAEEEEEETKAPKRFS